MEVTAGPQTHTSHPMTHTHESRANFKDISHVKLRNKRRVILDTIPCKFVCRKKEEREKKRSLKNTKSVKRQTKLPMNQKVSKVKRQGNCLAQGKERAFFFNYYFFKMLI